MECLVSYLEIYNETIHDLLLTSESSDQAPKLDVKTHPQLGVYIPGLTESAVTSASEVDSLLAFGTQVGNFHHSFMFL